MSLITRCPACATMFKVVPDQLRISDGWVRCGHCTEVFDAYSRMISADEAGAVIAAQAPSDEDLPSPAQTHPEPVAQAEPEPTAPPSFEPVAKLETEQVMAQVAQVAEPQPAEPGFLREGRRKAFWRKAWVRAVLALVALILLSALTLQVAVDQRNGLAAAEPRLKPWLQTLCEPLACELAHPKRIESLAIDSSSFNRMGADSFRLRFTLRNNAALELAVPSMELTLTDAQDRPVLRRVLMPAELSAPPVLAALGEWSSTVHIRVDAAVDEKTDRKNRLEPIAGYRLLAFYP